MAETGEFELIARYFSGQTTPRQDVALGIGDDCALLTVPAGHRLAVSIDTLVEQVHFFADVDAEKLGYKSLAVGLSDLAAMGARPAWLTLALTMPEVNESWLAGFSRGVIQLANQYQMQLVGGDTTQGPLTISIQVHGFVPVQSALTRRQAQAGDIIFVSGTLGDAGAGLRLRAGQWHDPRLDQNDIQFLIQRLECPTARVELGQALMPLASSAVDISDGLSADLGHILEQSGVGACLDLEQFPLSAALKKIDADIARQFALHSGDDYELCFTVPPQHVAEVEGRFGHRLTRIGEIIDKAGLFYRDGQTLQPLKGQAYAHFTH